MTTAQGKSTTGKVDVGSQSGSGYVWLAYSVFFFIDPFLRHNSRYWLQSLAIYLVFLAAYIAYLRARTTPQRQWLLAAFYLIGVLALPFNGGATTFFIYAAAFLPFTVASAPAVVVILALQCLGLVAEGLLVHLNPIAY